MSSSNSTSLISPVSNGILDQLGNGQVVSGVAQLTVIPLSIASTPSDNWFIAQWGQPQLIDFSGYSINNPSTYDPIYGNALYSYINPAITPALAVYQNTTALGGGGVVQITNGNTLLPPSQGQTNESDEFLSTQGGFSNSNLGHPIDLTLNLKVLQSIIQYTDSAARSNFINNSSIFSIIDIGFTMNFNGAGGLPGYSGFVQIVPWSSNGGSTAYYNGAEPSNTNYSFQFVSSLLLPGDNNLSLLPSDAKANPTTLSFSVNKYVANTFAYEFNNLSPSQQAIVENQSNWTLGTMYIGVATNDAQFADPLLNYTVQEAANISATVQISNMNLTTNLNQTYSSGISASSSPYIDTNPIIEFYDSNHQNYGTVDGGYYSGTLSGIQDEYIYTSSDYVDFTVTNGAGWLVNPGYGNSTVQATNGFFDLQLTPSPYGPRQITLASPAQEIIFDKYTILPTISTQNLLNGELSITISDQTVLTLADPTSNSAVIVGDQIQLHPPISYFDQMSNQQVATFGNDYSGSLPGITDEFNYSGTNNINLTISNGNSWLIDVANSNQTISVMNGTVSLLIEPDNNAIRTISLESIPSNIYFGSFSSQPTIVSQSIINNIQNIILSNNTQLFLPSVSNDLASIVGNQVIETTPCFLIFTNIATPSRNKPVQSIKIGDEILTANGQTTTVKWIGRRSYRSNKSENEDFWPIQIKAGALKKNIPISDLFLSPRHGILINDLLIPAAALVNGVSVVRRTDFDRIDYFHIETEDHDIILANDTPVESFIDINSRQMFENAAEYTELYADYVKPKNTMYDRVESGRRIEIIRKKLANRCDVSMTAKKGRTITAFIDKISENEIIGWASATDDLLVRCKVKIIGTNNDVLSNTVANEFRRDVQHAGIGDGRYGFRIRIPSDCEIGSLIFM